MGERKGQQKYYPPDWRPEHGSLDKYWGTHPLRDRARKLDRGILIIRFEMPFNIWCDGCNNHIGMGVRYNAEKTKVGMYYSTPIYKFSMKCVYCPSIIQIQTDPKNCDYTVMSGARRQNNRWKAQDAEQIEAVEYNEKQRLRNDAMFNLDYGHKDKTKAAKEIPSLAEIYHIQDTNWKDCYSANSLLRKKFREEKKQILANEKADDEIVEKLNLNFELVPEEENDLVEAKETLRVETAPGSVAKSGRRSLGVKLTPKAVKLRTIKRSLSLSLSKHSGVKKLKADLKTCLTGLVAKKKRTISSKFDSSFGAGKNSDDEKSSSGDNKIETSSSQVCSTSLNDVQSGSSQLGLDRKSTSLMSLAGIYSDSESNEDAS